MSPDIYQHWVHSYEEDGNGMQVYRPEDYDFPPSRGRGGFELKENKQFILYTIGPTDRPQALLGNWRIIDSNKLKVYFESKADQSFNLEIVEIDKQYLKIIRTFD
ncbi:hypothetical protein Xen7305DRAFT_00014420 [Xenococcus sp. PCC 7305]|uniref:hypothetical protein n=1 Tax=Xenococcus sp. PCC 7305 TaxID=102125 RepID=UPI0002ACD82C|nr:hypothetical protein [Xenococcus sp. PCC 7305]ELS01737.1 hypothetical protein Xen7305DRAFT_00014420 [Xenococcus sp. PCC 7305]